MKNVQTNGNGKGPHLPARENAKLVGIGTTAKLVRLSERTLRYWEMVGLVRPHRTPGGHRKYSMDQVKEIIRVKAAVKKGHLRLSDLMASREFLKDETLQKRMKSLLPTEFVDSEALAAAKPREGLVDNFFLQQEITRRVSEKMPTSIAYLDVQNLFHYGKRYGYDRAERVVATMALVIFDTVRDWGNKNDVIGQIAPHHFVVVTSHEKVDLLASHLIRAFDELAPLQYDEEDRRRGHILIPNRKGEPEKKPFLRLSIEVVSNALRPLTNYLHVRDIASELRKVAERFDHSDFVVDRRTK